MALFGWFKKKEKDSKVKVTERRKNTLQDMAVAAAFAEAGEHEAARSMIAKSDEKRSILAIGREDSFSEALTEYSLAMAKRLGFELVALNVTDAPLSLPAARREDAIEFFKQSSAKNISALKEQAEKDGVTFNHVIEIGDQDAAIDNLHAEYPGMRYVLTEPDPEVAKKSNGKADIPVFALGAVQNAAA